jgi:hypothetical protein
MITEIDGFALAAMGGDGVAVGEVAIVDGQETAIFETNPAGGVHGRHGDQFAICEPALRFAAVCSQKESISTRHLNWPRLQHIETTG